MLRRALLLTFIMVLFQPGGALADWDLSKALIPTEAIRSGGPPKDGIPALLTPKFITADEAGFLNAGDTVIGFAWGGQAKAYPLRIMSWHESVNDRLAGHPFLVSW